MWGIAINVGDFPFWPSSSGAETKLDCQIGVLLCKTDAIDPMGTLLSLLQSSLV